MYDGSGGAHEIVRAALSQLTEGLDEEALGGLMAAVDETMSAQGRLVDRERGVVTGVTVRPARSRGGQVVSRTHDDGARGWPFPFSGTFCFTICLPEGIFRAASSAPTEPQPEVEWECWDICIEWWFP